MLVHHQFQLSTPKKYAIFICMKGNNPFAKKVNILVTKKGKVMPDFPFKNMVKTNLLLS